MTNQVMGTATPKSSMMTVSVQSAITGIPTITYRNLRVITTELLASGYGTLPNNLQMNFNNNRRRFVEGKHYFLLSGEDLRDFKNLPNNLGLVSKHTSQLVLWTERGASRHAKMLETDQAWDFYEDLEENYFRLTGDEAPRLPNFSDPVQAARAWADEREARQLTEAINHQQSEYIGHLESLFTDGLSPVQFCKRLNGVNTSKVNGWLLGANWLYDDNPDGKNAHWRVRSYARDKYLTEKSSKVMPSESVSFTTYQPVLLRDGAIWLYKKYLKGHLPMKQSWNGQFTHDKELSGGGE